MQSNGSTDAVTPLGTPNLLVLAAGAVFVRDGRAAGQAAFKPSCYPGLSKPGQMFKTGAHNAT